MGNHLNEHKTLWDLGIADLIEETPHIGDARKTRFKTVTRNDQSNVYLLRLRPSWKTPTSHQLQPSW